VLNRIEVGRVGWPVKTRDAVLSNELAQHTHCVYVSVLLHEQLRTAIVSLVGTNVVGNNSVVL
jgi:hypothetical protein